MTITPDSPTCGNIGCSGIRIEGFKHCLGHLSPDNLDQFLGRLRPGADLDARGTMASERLLVTLAVSVQQFGELNFQKATFEDVEKVGPIVAQRLNLDGARFTRRVEIEVDAAQVTCVGTRFDGGVTLRVRNATIDATNVNFGAPSSISTSLAWGAPIPQPKLVSLRGTDVSNLVLVDVDLSWCLFVGAHRLDQLRLEDRCRLSKPPAGWRWSQRQLLAEECLARGWADQHPFVPDAFVLRWERIAALYRSLRKAFEDSKNEAGAGDFYYGEMEARRRSELTPPAERGILWVYWLLSGYGQRAGRAIVGLGVLVAIVCVLLFAVGLPGGVDWTWGRVDQSVRIGMGAVVFREAGQTLTSAGSWTVMVARFVGPVLLALGVLAIRARVKR